MPTIAQKLCHDIVDSTFRSSSNTIRNPSTKFINRLSNQKSPDKTAQSALNDKNRIITNVRPFPLHPNGKTHCKSRDTLLKERRLPTHKPINTLLSGPTKCNNNCVTLVRKQEPTCKCARKKLNNVSAKQIQTLVAGNNLYTDNACTQCTETASSGIRLLKGSSYFKSKPRHHLCVSTETRPQQSHSQSTVKPSVSVKSKPVYETPTIILKKAECSFIQESVNEKSRNCSKKRQCPFRSETIREEAKNHTKITEFHVRPQLNNDKSTDCSEERDFLLRSEKKYGIPRYPEKSELSFDIEKISKKSRNNSEKREFPFLYINKPWAISNYPKRGPDF